MKASHAATASLLKLLVFLGNPGDEYEKTRHNFAWRLLPHLDPPLEQWKPRFQGEITRYSAGPASAWLLKPLTLMNLSGRSVAAAAQYFRILPSEILVVHDDLELDFGWIARKYAGGLGGHNGLRSIADSLGTRDFPRLRLGISRPGRGSVTAWVLGNFSKHENHGVEEVARAGAMEVTSLLRDGFSLSGDPRRRIYPPASP